MPTPGPPNRFAGRRSRCTVVRASNLRWADYLDDTHPSATELTEWILSLAPFARESVLGDIDALLALAASGSIVDGDDSKLKPIRHNPDLYELKWQLLSKAVRQYHAEPPSHPEHLVKLHIHIKKFDSDGSVTSRLQDQEISQSKLRYVAGQRGAWGLL